MSPYAQIADQEGECADYKGETRGCRGEYGSPSTLSKDLELRGAFQTGHSRDHQAEEPGRESESYEPEREHPDREDAGGAHEDVIVDRGTLETVREFSWTDPLYS